MKAERSQVIVINRHPFLTGKVGIAENNMKYTIYDRIRQFTTEYDNLRQFTTFYDSLRETTKHHE